MKFRDLLEITKIQKIIWIDDDFYTPSASGSSDYRLEVKQHIQAVLDMEDPEQNQEIFNQLEVDRDPYLDRDSLEMEMDDWLAEVSDSRIREFAHHHNLLEENTRNMVEFLQQDGCVDVITLSHYQWLENKEEILADPDRKLFLIDKEFEKEGGGKTTGFEIIKEVHGETGLSELDQCVLFTHIVTDDFEEEEKARKEYLDQINAEATPSAALKPPSFMVMSKGRIQDPDFDSVELGLHNSFIRRILYQVAVGISEKASFSSEETIKLLMAANMTDAAKIFFKTTRKEGVSEVELLYRILASGWERSLYRHLSESSSLSELIYQGRRISSFNDDQASMGSGESMELFHQLRKQELWLEGDVINKNYLPMRCGDVFEIHHPPASDDSGEEHVAHQYILIAPPCELMIRENGDRKLKEAVLLPIKEKALSAKKASEERSKQFNFVFKEIETFKSTYIVELNSSVAVNLSVLDICSFNVDGCLDMKLDSEIDEHKIPSGFCKRFRRIQEVLNQSESAIRESAIGSLFNFPPPLLGDPEKVTLTELKIGRGEINAPVKRVKRLSSAHTEQVMNAFYSFRARKAMEYDFAK